jgi:hypothetical protein
MYVKDLRTKKVDHHEPLLTFVGWLAEKHPYERGEVDPVLFPRLFEICRRSRVLTRGRHWCDFCPKEKKFNPKATLGDTTLRLGSGEILVAAPGSDVVYYAPDMICHYIAEHGYRPPDKFVQAVMSAE